MKIALLKHTVARRLLAERNFVTATMSARLILSEEMQRKLMEEIAQGDVTPIGSDPEAPKRNTEIVDLVDIEPNSEAEVLLTLFNHGCDSERLLRAQDEVLSRVANTAFMRGEIQGRNAGLFEGVPQLHTD